MMRARAEISVSAPAPTSPRLRKLLGMLAMLITSLTPALAAAADQSRFMPIDETHCKVISQDDETNDVTRRCHGPVGYKLLVVESDDRVSMTIVTPSGNELPLDFWKLVTPTFSTLGPAVEWRTRTKNSKTDVVGLVVRVDTFNQSDVTKPQPYSVMVAARISPSATCITSLVMAELPKSAELARRSIADDQPCLNHPIAKPSTAENN